MTGMDELEQFTREIERLKGAMRRNGKVSLTIHPFRMGTDKGAALKPLEEAAEVFGAWQAIYTVAPLEICIESGYPLCECEHKSSCSTFKEPSSYTVRRDILADEIADCIQACVNLADRYGIDLTAAMGRCEERNFRRGWYGAETGIEVDG